MEENKNTESVLRSEKFNKWLNEVFDHDKLIGFKWSNLINEFLWLCAGANRKVLRQCPTEHAKYAGTGGTILFTAILACFSGGYAIYKVFADEIYDKSKEIWLTDMNAVYIAIIFGIIWGLMIFNLDRFMVNTMFSDGTHKITKEERIGAAPRLILAVFIGIVISTPLELRIFKDKIQTQLIIDQGIEKQKMDNEHKNLYKQIQEKEKLKDANVKKLDSLKVELAKAEGNLYNETIGLSGTGKFGYGPAAKMLQERVDGLRRDTARMAMDVKEMNQRIDKQLAPLYKDMEEYSNGRNAAEKSMKGFAAELTALNEITFQQSVSLSMARILIMLLFVAIEVIPTIFKLMMIDGAYDAVLALEKHRAKVVAKEQESNLNDTINTNVQILTEKNKERFTTEVLANKELMEKIAKTQAELLQTAIDKWREEELAKINENPSAYIRTNQS